MRVFLPLLLAGAVAACTGDITRDSDDVGDPTRVNTTGTVQTWPFDGGISDAPVIDSPGDAAPVDAVLPPDAWSPPFLEYQLLSQTGLYDDIATKDLADDVVEFEPAYALWSDGAAKRRWIRLPGSGQVDTSNMDAWQFPIGTQLWKEFIHVGQGGAVRIETRLIERRGPDPDDLWMGSFRWNTAETEAAYVQWGATNVKGTGHDIPAHDHCIKCHRGQPSRVLAFSAVQLSHDQPNHLGDLAAAGWFTDPPPPGLDYRPPGDPTAAAALGYLHANCGHCHTPDAGLACYDVTGLSLRLYTTDQTVLQTDAFATAVDQPLAYWTDQGFDYRIVPGNPAASALHFRMAVRGDDRQMPPAFTDAVDAAGTATVAAWIEAL